MRSRRSNLSNKINHMPNNVMSVPPQAQGATVCLKNLGSGDAADSEDSSTASFKVAMWGGTYRLCPGAGWSTIIGHQLHRQEPG